MLESRRRPPSSFLAKSNIDLPSRKPTFFQPPFAEVLFDRETCTRWKALMECPSLLQAEKGVGTMGQHVMNSLGMKSEHSRGRARLAQLGLVPGAALPPCSAKACSVLLKPAVLSTGSFAGQSEQARWWVFCLFVY